MRSVVAKGYKISTLSNFKFISKKTSGDSLNDYTPVALTSVIKKYFKWILSLHVRDCAVREMNS